MERLDKKRGAMKIKIVIIDELPKSCNECPYPFGVQNKTGWWCGIMQIGNNIEYEYPANNCKDRPEWCPLVSIEEYEKELDAGLNAYLGIDELLSEER